MRLRHRHQSPSEACSRIRGTSKSSPGGVFRHRNSRRQGHRSNIRHIPAAKGKRTNSQGGARREHSDRTVAILVCRATSAGCLQPRRLGRVRRVSATTVHTTSANARRPGKECEPAKTSSGPDVWPPLKETLGPAVGHPFSPCTPPGRHQGEKRAKKDGLGPARSDVTLRPLGTCRASSGNRH